MGFSAAKGAGRKWYLWMKGPNGIECAGDKAIREICIPENQIVAFSAQGAHQGLYRGPLTRILVRMNWQSSCHTCWMPSDEEVASFLQKADAALCRPPAHACIRPAE